MDELERAANNQSEFINYILQKHKNRKILEEEMLKHRNADDIVYCEDCGKQIPLQRLRVVPTATRCVDCQRKYEEGE